MSRSTTQRLDHLHERIELVGGEVLDQPEVEEGDPPARLEQVVARVRIAVEGVQLVQRPEGEPVDRLGRQVFLLLGPAEHLGEPRPGGELAGDHPGGAELVDDPRDGDRGVAVEVGGELPLAVGFAQVVELLADPLPQLLDQLGHVLAGRGHPQQGAEQPHVAEVGGDRLGDPRVLHLDRDGPPVASDRAVHLADRGGGDRQRVPLGEDLVRRRPELGPDDARGELRRHRRHAVLQPAEHPAGGRREPVVHVAGELPELHQHALHRAERVGDVLGGAQRQVVAELLALLPGRREEPGRVRRVPGAAPGGKPHRGQPPADPQARLAHWPPARIRRVSRCRASSTPGSPR